ncbi:alpha/beta fold hydrolase [Sediminivirga luteola]|uniref:alpha/beta fold hydrolase n=1 Tax=Sediminivirga luteola TaxID=1774748 RepID=UPI001F57F652|nr:alpha/beta fold hydrolase [Sediminivirga luteola]MCI2265138.1 alpha/beta hydrolase [Sediminivirga luteola]
MTEETIVLIPGTETPADVAFAGLKPLLERDHRVVLFDYTSESQRDLDAVLEGYHEQLRVAIAELGRPVHLFGYSLGAHIALRYAATESSRVLSLALAGGWLRTDELQRSRHELWLDLYDQEPRLAGRLSHLLQYSPKYRRYLAEQQTAARLTPATPDEEIRRRVEINRLLDSSRHAADIEVPTLLIAGTADAKVSIEAAYELFGTISTAAFAPMDAGHALLKERLGQVYGCYADFLRGRYKAGQYIKSFLP